jgi:hypothetical protein
MPSGFEGESDPGEGYEVVSASQINRLSSLAWGTWVATAADLGAARVPPPPQFISLADAVLCRVPRNLSSKAEFVVLKFPLPIEIEEARNKASSSESSEETKYNLRTLLLHCLLFTIPFEVRLELGTRQWIGKQILKLANERIRQKLRSFMHRRFSRQLLAYHCREHEGFEDLWIREMFEYVDSGTRLPEGNLRSYILRGRRAIDREFGGHCPLDKYEDLAPEYQVALSEVRRHREATVRLRESGVLED